jgi:hypothetical protein
MCKQSREEGRERESDSDMSESDEAGIQDREENKKEKEVKIYGESKEEEKRTSISSDKR